MLRFEFSIFSSDLKVDLIRNSYFSVSMICWGRVRKFALNDPTPKLEFAQRKHNTEYVKLGKGEMNKMDKKVKH